MSDIRLITFDLDNTLWDVDRIIIRAEGQMKAWLAQRVPESLEAYTPETLGPIRKQVAARYPDRVHDLSFMRIEVLYELMRSLGLSKEQSRAYARGAFDVFYTGRNQVEFFNGALAMLDTLSQRFPLIALTNGNAHIERAGIDRYFKAAFSAADVGSSKPSPEMFHAALNELDLAPEEAIHVGDNLVDDIRGASNVGMHSIWVNLNDQQVEHDEAAPSVEVKELAAIPDAVAEVLALADRTAPGG